MLRVGECNQCAACCKTLYLHLVPETYQRSDVRKWVELHGFKLLQRGDNLFAQLDIPCGALTVEGKCSLHGTPEKPLMCVTFPSETIQLEGLPECSYEFIELTEKIEVA